MDSAQTRDATIITRLRDGDRDAFDVVVRQFHGPLTTYIARTLGTRDIADDLVQELFLRLWRGRARLDAAGNLTTYLYSAARNQIRDHFRRRRAALTVETTLAWEQVVHEPSNPADLDTDLDLREMTEALQRAVEQFPERCRAVWVLSREHGLSNAEVAEVLEISVNTVKTQLARAFGVLRSVARPFLTVVLATLVGVGS